MQFIVVSSDMSENPLIYTTDTNDLMYGLRGFTMKSGRKYRGLDKLLTDVKWHTESGIWNISYDDHQNNGVRKVSLFDNFE
jgi:hypothetical protein